MPRSLAIMLIGALVATAGCGRVTATQIDVSVSAKFCPAGTSDCYLLRVPNADVLAKSGTTAVSTTTDESGMARLKLPGGGQYTIFVDSPVLKKEAGKDRIENTVVVDENRRSTVAIEAEIAKD